LIFISAFFYFFTLRWWVLGMRMSSGISQRAASDLDTLRLKDAGDLLVGQTAWMDPLPQ